MFIRHRSESLQSNDISDIYLLGNEIKPHSSAAPLQQITQAGILIHCQIFVWAAAIMSSSHI